MNFKTDNYDVIVVGAGFSGSILARLLAEKKGKRVLLLEKRNHIAGNMYDFDSQGIRVQKYGPHTFHTNRKHVFDFLQNYIEMEPYTLTYRAILKGVPVPCPFNLDTIEHLYSKEDSKILIDQLYAEYPNRESIPIFELLASKNTLVQSYARMLFDEDFKPYTSKQWGKSPEEIDESILKRVPIILNRRDSYFNDVYEALPKGGFTKLFENMLNHPNIKVVLNTDVQTFLTFSGSKLLFSGKEMPIIYTGPLDALFGFEYGRLPYRSLYFDNQHLPVRSFQDTAIVAYPKDVEFTRITEYTKLPNQDVGEHTFISYEYPLAYDPTADKGNEPFYPLLTDENVQMYKLYREKAMKVENLTICGRLADFKYYNMDEVVDHTLHVFNTIEGDF